MITITIDGKKVEVEKDTTLLQIALAKDIDIPHLCWDDRIRPFGGCRLCVVEVEGYDRLLSACSTPPENGMVIYTNSEAVINARKAVLDMLLIHHPLDCPVCDKAGNCKLQDLAYKYGSTESAFKEEKKHAVSAESPFIELNPNRCILCGKCVRVCWEHQGVGAINLIDKGFNTKISPAFQEVLDCEFCGQCVDACPVGALGSKPFKYMSLAWFLEERDNICPYCSVGCTITLNVRERRIISAKGVKNKGVNNGDLCGRGRYGVDFVYAANRLTTPLIRENGMLRQSTWDEVMQYLSIHLRKIIKTKGPDSIGAIGSPRCTIEDNYMLQKFMRSVIGTNNIDSDRFGYAKIQQAVEMTFGLHTLPISLNSPLDKDVLLVLESDITSTHPIWGLKFIEAVQKGAKLIVMDPRETKLSKRSSKWLRIKPGTSQAILNGIMKAAIDKGLHLKNKRSREAGNLDALIQLLKAYTIQQVSDIAEICSREFTEVIDMFLKGERRLTAITIGPAENNKGLGTALAASNMVMLLGDGPQALQMPATYSNTYGMWQMGITPDYLPGYEKITDKPGKNIFKMLYEKGQISALFIIGEDPLITYPDLNKLEEVLGSLDLIIAQDIRLTKTAEKFAHIVLPAASWAEKEGTFINAAGIRQKVNKIVEPATDATPDWKIFRNLSRAMHHPIGMDDLSALKEKIHQIKLHIGDEKWNYVPVPYEEMDPPDDDYPLLMVSGNIMQHSGAFSVMSKSLSHVFADSFVQINEYDAEFFGLKDGDIVTIESKRGQAKTKVRISDEVSRGMVFVPLHLKDSRMSELYVAYEGFAAPIIAVKIRK
ncbi:MAG: molybdopterin-dependent oxidoreductase [Candidatus Magnetoovum sp. WYHC-5]|nr:molybdopterin-dependent oxidoreductase [Candidatus Magnetoovum sp. WYHC-5]